MGHTLTVVNTVQPNLLRNFRGWSLNFTPNANTPSAYRKTFRNVEVVDMFGKEKKRLKPNIFHFPCMTLLRRSPDVAPNGIVYSILWLHLAC